MRSLEELKAELETLRFDLKRTRQVAHLYPLAADDEEMLLLKIAKVKKQIEKHAKKK